MARVLACMLFALAAIASVLASTGVGAPPHRMPPGTPLFHMLVIGAYRYGFLIEPVIDTRTTSPEMAALHRALALIGMPMTDMAGMEKLAGTNQGPIFAAAGLTPIQDLAIYFALLAVLVPRLPRPTRFNLGEIVPPALRATLWRSPLVLAPPRA